MGVDPTKTHTYSVRRPKAELILLREVARRMGTTPTKLIVAAFEKQLPRLLRKAGVQKAS